MDSIVADFSSKDFVRIIRKATDLTDCRAYVVGEYVRDYFLRRKCKEISIIVEGDAIELGQQVGALIHSRVSCFRNSGVSMVDIKGDRITISSAKKRVFDRNKREQVLIPGTIREYLKQRAFTIEAIAISLNEDDFGCLIDEYGGVIDISRGIIRSAIHPNIVFKEHPVDMLRAIRLVAQLSTSSIVFRITPDCLKAIRESAEHIDTLSRERIVEELNKMLLCDTPSLAFSLLEEIGILKRIIPSLSKTSGVKKIAKVGHEDSFSHSLKVVNNIARLESRHSFDETNSLGIRHGNPNLWLRWAALLHEIGKPAVKKYTPEKGWTFHGYEVVGERMVPDVFLSLKMPQDEKMRYVQKLISLQKRPMTLLDESTGESAYRRLLSDAGQDLDDLLLLCEANITTVNKAKANKALSELELVRQKLADVKEKEAIRNFKNPISANYIMELYGLEPCDTLGTLKDIIKTAILSGEIGNSFEEADILLRKIAAEFGLISLK